MQRYPQSQKRNKACVALLLCLAMMASLALSGLSAAEAAAATEGEESAAEGEPAPVLAEIVREPEPVLEDSPLRISELMDKNRAVLADSDGDFSDWIELENCSDLEVAMGGWRLTDRADREGFVFPEGSLKAGGRILVYASGKDRQEEMHAPFALSGGEELFLFDPKGRLAGSVTCPGGSGSSSWALEEDGQFRETLYPTPGRSNTPGGYDAWQDSLPEVTKLAIWEVMTADPADRYTELTGCGNWVELKNMSGEILYPQDFYLSDDKDKLQLYRLSGPVIQPGEKLLVPISREVARFSLSSQEDELYLSDGEGNILDYVSLRDIPYECSYGRREGEHGWFYFAEPTPGESNGYGYRRVSRTPVADTPDGVYDNLEYALQVGLSAPGTIYYSSDGNVPNTEYPVYTGPLTVAYSVILRAVAVEDGALPSRPLTLSFIVNEFHQLPVLSLVSDNGTDLAYIYRHGVKEVEVPGNLALYEDGERRFSIPCGIKMHGETSLYLNKKNMSVRFRGAYGQDRLSCDLYGGGITEFSDLVIRAGQDYGHAIIRNELCQNLALKAEADVITQRSKYCILYVNGEYYGIYNLMEKANGRHFADVAGVSQNSVEVWEANVPENCSLYQDVFLFCQTNDMRLSENYEEFCRRMDVDSLIDWLILEGYCANSDLNSGNLRYWRSDELDGKWRLAFYDLDAVFYTPSLNFANVLTDYERQYYQFVRPLMNNETFRDRFLTRAAELLNGPLSNESAVAELNWLASVVEPEVYRDYSRYGMLYSSWEWNVDQLRYFFLVDDWRQHNIDSLKGIFRLDDWALEHYFGA